MRGLKIFWRKDPDKILSRFKQVERYFFKTPDNLHSHSGNKWEGYLWETFQIVGFFALPDGYSLERFFEKGYIFAFPDAYSLEGLKKYFSDFSSKTGV